MAFVVKLRVCISVDAFCVILAQYGPGLGRGVREALVNVVPDLIAVSNEVWVLT